MIWLLRIGAVVLFVNVYIFAGFVIAYSTIDAPEDELWCGCYGAGMAHTAGAKGFACEVVD